VLLTGTWTKLTTPFPNGDGAETMLQLSDGSVMITGGAGFASKDWYKLTPDATGSYVNGTFSQLASMGTERLFYSSDVLPDGRVYVAGGEYSGPNSNNTDTNTGEIYDPVANSWTPIKKFPEANLGDATSETIRNGLVMESSPFSQHTYIYDPSSNTWSNGPDLLDGDFGSEEGWVKLGDGSTLQYEISGSKTPAANRLILGATDAQDQWVSAGSLPVQLDSNGGSNAIVPELGPSFLLPDGRAFWVGASQNTALYTPPSPGNPTGTWVAGPVQKDSGGNAIGAFDAPGAMEANGKVLWAASQIDANTFGGPITFLEYDPASNSISQVKSPGPNIASGAFTSRMLALPSGQILFGSGVDSDLWVYTPDSAPNPAWAPKISSIVANGPNSFTLTGTQLTGLSQGAAYGDDAQMATNFPLVRLTDSSGNVFFARTTNWSSTWVATGNTSQTVNFTVPAAAGTGPFNLSVIANGIASTAVTFSTGIAVSATAPSNVTETKPFTAQVATFKDSSNLPASDFTATIDWGDGTSPTTASVQSVGVGDYVVTGGHTYAVGGSYTMTVTVKDTTTQDVGAGIAQVNVSALPLITSPVAVNGFEGNPVSSLLATFTDTYPGTTNASEYSATITWGDGSTSIGTISSNGSGFNVTGAKSYADEGQYGIQVQINGLGGAVAFVNTSATVSDAPLSSSATSFSPVVGTAFSGAVVHFTDGNPTAQSSDFAATIDWGDGTTTLGSVVSSAGGGFDASGTHTYHVAGKYTVSVSIKDVGTATTSVSSTITVSDAAITGVLGPVGSQEGSPYSGVVASFTDANPFAVLGQFSATIKWGDSQTSTGTIQTNGSGGFDVVSNHTYITAGSYALEVDITSSGGAAATVTGQFVVQDAPILAQPTSVAATAGVMFSGPVATFTDFDPTARPASHYSATISWGDGTTTAGSIVSAGGGVFTVNGNHQYATVGTDSLVVTVKDAQGSKSTITDTGVVTDAAIVPTGTSFSAIAGNTFSGVVATFTDANLGAPASYFLSTITWGDGTNTRGTVVSQGNGNFNITGTHVYAEPGISITGIAISDAGGASAQTAGSANVADAPLSPSPLSFTLTEGAVFSGAIANFSDTNIFAIAGEFSAQINWGDGTSSAGTVVGNGHGSFSVTGTHIYINPGNYDAHASVLHNAGSSTAIDSSVAVVPAPITALAVAINVVAGSSNPNTVAKFIDSDPTQRPPSMYAASVSWGDGAVSSGAVQVDPAGGFDVVATHVYQFGSYPFAVTLQKTGGGGVQVSGMATVSDAPMTPGAPLTISGGEGSTFNGLVGSFSDSNLTLTPSNFLATITWGDGQTSAGTISSLPGNQFGVSGTHVYGAGNYLTSVTVTDLGGGKVTLSGNAQITDVPLSATGVAVSAVEGANFQGAVATFTDSDPRLNPASNYSATINWGDGLTTAGTVTFDSVNRFYTVSGLHAFGAGTFTVSTTITDQGGTTAGTTSTATVTDAALSATAVPLNTTPADPDGKITPPSEGQTFSGVVATFTDADPRPNPVGNYSATIAWGDHTTTLGTITSTTTESGIVYSVSGSHAYSFGDFTVAVAVHDIGGSISTVTQPVSVSDAKITASPVSILMQEGVLFSGVVGQFSDADPRVEPSSNFTATVDWGDGTKTAGAVVPNPSGGYNVIASHSYPEEGKQSVTVTVNDVGGMSDSAQSSVLVADARLTATAAPFAAISQTPFSGIVGAFADANTAAAATDFQAVIFWGDGTSSAGSIAKVGANGFDVLGNHQYAEGGSYAASFSVSDAGGSSTQSARVVSVADKVFAMTGRLDPGSDSGASASDGITNDTTPKFDGTAEPNATVNIYVERAPVPAPLLVGTTKADAAGNWSVTSGPLIDGVYSLFGSATDQFGRPSTPFTQLLPSATQGSIVIDTQGPRVAGLTLVPSMGVFLVTFQDDLGGLNEAALMNGANYSLSMPFVKGDPTFTTTAVVTTPATSPTAAQVVAVKFNTPAKLKPGNYVITISEAGITDLAGNNLVERFFIPLPSHGYRPGQNYEAQINYNGKVANPPQQYFSPAELAAAAKHRKMVGAASTVAIRKRK
jgi:hypothetical protein